MRKYDYTESYTIVDRVFNESFGQYKLMGVKDPEASALREVKDLKVDPAKFAENETCLVYLDEKAVKDYYDQFASVGNH